MTKAVKYHFAGTDGLVDLSECDPVVQYLPGVFPKWPYTRVQGEPTGMDTLFSVAHEGDGFVISSDIFGTRQHLHNPLNAACSLVAELAWAQLRLRPSMLCFHGAAVEMNGGLVLFPNKYRAGKSTLTACLAALGYRVFTDDYLPIDVDENGVAYGYANGAAPRLRLPVPEEFSPEFKAWLAAASGPSNKQYLYLDAPDGILAEHGQRLPISTIVLLDRQAGSDMTMTEADPARILRRVILQNFSRDMNPAYILGMIDHIAVCAKGFELRYESAEAAAAHLSDIMQDRSEFDARAAYHEGPDLADAELVDDPLSIPFEVDARYVRAGHVMQRDYETDCFVASTHGATIHHMDSIARAIWTVLEVPSNLDDIVGTFQEAFPDESEAVLRKDIGKTLSRFAKDGLLEKAS